MTTIPLVSTQFYPRMPGRVLFCCVGLNVVVSTVFRIHTAPPRNCVFDLVASFSSAPNVLCHCLPYDIMILCLPVYSGIPSVALKR